MPAASLQDIFAASAPRENAGSPTLARYDFQANYSILKLISLSSTGTDFRMVFEYFDDLMVMNSSVDPSHIELFQIKSKDPGEWTIPALCTKKGAEPPFTFATRLYDHERIFGDILITSAFVSNAPYVVMLADGSRTTGTHLEVYGEHLHPDELLRIEAAIKREVPSGELQPWIGKLRLYRTTLGVHDQRAFVIGKLQEYIDDLTGAPIQVKTSALYDTLHGTIIAKTTSAVDGLSPEQAIDRRSFTKIDFTNLLVAVLSRPRSIIDDWNIMSSELAQAGYGSVQIIRLRTSSLRFIASRTAGHKDAARIMERVDRWFQANLDAFETYHGLLSIAQILSDEIRTEIQVGSEQALGACLVLTHERANEPELDGVA